MSVGRTVSCYLYIYALVYETFFFPFNQVVQLAVSAYFTFPVNDTRSAHVRLVMRKIGDVFT